MPRAYRGMVPADSVCLVAQESRVHVSRIITFPNTIDLTVIRTYDDVMLTAHLSVKQCAELIAALAEALAYKPTL